MRVHDSFQRPIRQVGGYRELAPPVDLEHVVDAWWTYAVPREASGVGPKAIHRLLPELGFSLYFECWRDASGRVGHGALHLQGPIRRVEVWAAAGSLRIEAVRVKPEWCRELFGADATEHADGFALYRAVNRVRADRLYDRLTRTTTTAEALHELGREVRERYGSARRGRALALANGAAESIRTSARELPLADVARRVGVTERHLRRILHVATGLGPKQFHRVHRLNRAVAAADHTTWPAWARIAAEAGYYDQSHMIHDFRAITGRAPCELHAERQAENQPR